MNYYNLPTEGRIKVKARLYFPQFGAGHREARIGIIDENSGLCFVEVAIPREQLLEFFAGTINGDTVEAHICGLDQVGKVRERRTESWPRRATDGYGRDIPDWVEVKAMSEVYQHGGWHLTSIGFSSHAQAWQADYTRYSDDWRAATSA